MHASSKPTRQTAARLTGRLLDVCCAVLLAGIWLAATPQAALAYLDPSIMTYAIQSLAGVAIAMSAVLGVAWRKVRGRVFRALEIDPDAKKLVDPPVHATAPGAAPQTSPLVAPKRTRVGTPGSKSWPRRFGWALLACGFSVFTMLVFTPLSTIAENHSDFLFHVGHVAAPVVLAGLVLSVVAALLVSLLGGKAYELACALVVALGVCAYVQLLALNTGLPPADGTEVDWAHFAGIARISAGVWLAVIVAFVALALAKPVLTRTIAVVLGVLLFATQALSLALALPGSLASFDNTVTKNGLFTVSPKSNVIVFVLDYYDNLDFDQYVSARPEILDEYTGFTYYPNATGSFEQTRYALPFLLTGDWSQAPGDNDRWTNGTQFLDDIGAQGYSVGVYSPKTYRGKNVFADQTINIERIDPTINWRGTLAALYRCALYRELHWTAKPHLQFYTEDINAAVVEPADSGDWQASAYYHDDAVYYRELQEYGLEASDEAAQGAFRFIHLLGHHPPFVLTEDAVFDEAAATPESQGIAAIKIVGRYLELLKATGVYDQSTIIVTTDHGNCDAEEIEPTRPINPILLVKPAHQGPSRAQEPCQTSPAATGHLDFHATVMDAVGAAQSRYPGIPIYQVPETEERERYFTKTVNPTLLNDANTDTEWVEYAIDGNAQDIANWHQTGRSWKPIRPD